MEGLKAKLQKREREVDSKKQELVSIIRISKSSLACIAEKVAAQVLQYQSGEQELFFANLGLSTQRVCDCS